MNASLRLLSVIAALLALAGLPADPALDGVNLIPFLTGEKSGPPHETLFWRWRSQAAVLEGKWKLVLLGTQRHLFDTSTPDGETRNLLATYPEIGDRLYAKLQAWDATLCRCGGAACPQAADVRDGPIRSSLRTSRSTFQCGRFHA